MPTDDERDEVVRLQFRCVALEAHVEELRHQLDADGSLRQMVATLETHAQALSDELRAARADRERLVAALMEAAELNRRSLAQIMSLGPERLQTLATLGTA